MILSRKTSLVGNLGGHSSSDKSLSGNEGDMTLQSVYDLCLSLCVQVSDQAKEIQHLKAQIKKLKKQAKPVIKHHRAWLKSVSLKQRLTRKRFSKKQRVHQVSVSKQGRKFAKVDHMETENAQDVGRTREIVDEEKEIDENILSTEDVLSTDKETVSTDKEKVYVTDRNQYTDGQRKGTEDHTEEGSATQATQTPTSTIFGDDETIAKVLLNMSQAKAVSREKEKDFQDEDPAGFDRVLWGDLMVMFNPDDENEYWNSQQDWIGIILESEEDSTMVLEVELDYPQEVTCRVRMTGIVGLLQLVTSSQFHGFKKDNPHAHIPWFNKITSTLKYKNIPHDAIKLMLFPFSLEGDAQIWLEKEPPHSIHTWEDIVSKFVNYFFPPSKTMNLKNDITNFQQKFDETFSEAWDHFKDLLRKCPQHSFSELHQIDTFYNALTQSDQDSLNAAAGGNLLNRAPRDALTIIENKSKVRTSRNKLIVSKVSTTTSSSSPSPDVTALTEIVKELVLMNKANQQVSV
ncbi:reverse transcriptase domain-containing protein, partial [Tanacetum coccineum]